MQAPLSSAAADVTYAGASIPPWLVLVLLGVVTAALAYTAGIAAGQRQRHARCGIVERQCLADAARGAGDDNA